MKFRLLIASAALLTSSHAWAAEVSLIDALAQGAQSSPRVAQARAQAQAAEARARQAGVSPNPEISLEVENFAGTGPYRDTRSAETTLALSQRIELGGKRSARMAVAGAERDFALIALKRAEADLGRDIRIAFAALRAAEDLAVLARENVAQAQALARSASLFVEVGRDPPLRKLRADSLLADAKAEQARTFGELLAARRLLADLIGSSDPELSANVGEDNIRPALLPPETPSLDEQLAASERDAARARIRVAKADGVPDVTASGGVRRINDGRETAFVAGFSIPLPIRDRNRGNIEAAGADSLALEAALAQARLDARRAGHDARMLLGAAEERVAALSGPALAQAEEALRLASVGYAAGKFSLIELIDAQTALTATRKSLIDARLDRARALAALIRANAQ